MSNHPHKRGQKAPMEPTAPTQKLQSDYSVVHSRPKTPETAKIRLFDRNLREEKLSSQPDQPGGNFFSDHNKTFCRKKFTQTRLFYCCCMVLSFSSLE